MESRKIIPITWKTLNSIIKDTDNQTLKEHMILPSLAFSAEISERYQNILKKKGKLGTDQQLSAGQHILLVRAWSLRGIA